MEMSDVGRPTVMTDDVIQKLEDAFLNDCNDLQACFLANISKSTFYDYLKEHPEFSDRIEMLKDDTKIKAKKAVKNAILTEERPDTAKWYLERKAKDEFSSRVENTGADGKDLIPSPIIPLNEILANNSDQSNNTAQQED